MRNSYLVAVISEYDSGRRSEMAQSTISLFTSTINRSKFTENVIQFTLSKLNKYSSKRLTEKDIVDPFNKQNSAQLIALFDKVPIMNIQV